MSSRIINKKGTSAPSFSVFSNGVELGAEFAIASFVVKRNVNRIPTAKLIVQDGDIAMETFDLSEGDAFIPGAEIEIKAGYDSLNETIFKGIVIKQCVKADTEHGTHLVVDMRDASVKMTVGRKNNIFEEETDSSIMEQLISDNGLTPDVESTDLVHTEMIQYYCTDWDFLLSRTDVNGQLVFVTDGTIKVAAPEIAGTGVLNLAVGHNIIEVEATMDARDQYKATKSFSWDAGNQEALEAEGKEPSLTEQGNISGSELADVIGLNEFELRHTGIVENDELQAWSDAKLMRSRLSKIRGRVKIEGYNKIQLGDTIQLEGLGGRFNGLAFVAGFCHQLSPDSAFLTDIEFGLSQEWFSTRFTNIFKPPAAGLVPPMHGLQIGVVTDLEDPEDQNRIRVQLPIIDGESEGVWARMTRPDAGAGDSNPRGIFFNPEIDDEVVVGFFDDDPRDPVILGSLFSSANPSPYDQTADNNEKGIVTRSEMKLTFDDDAVTVTIETPNGNKVTLSDDEGSIVLEDENRNKIEMTSDGITIESGGDINITTSTGDVNIEGLNISNTAQAEFSADGTAGASVTSSAIAALKGSAQTAIG